MVGLKPSRVIINQSPKNKSLSSGRHGSSTPLTASQLSQRLSQRTTAETIARTLMGSTSSLMEAVHALTKVAAVASRTK